MLILSPNHCLSEEFRVFGKQNQHSPKNSCCWNPAFIGVLPKPVIAFTV